MALKIRLRKQGRTNRASYRLVVTDSRARRDGKYIETLGWYNPVEQVDERLVSLKGERIKHWLDQGAQLTEKAQKLVKMAAPEVAKAQTERLVARKTKSAAKKRARRKAVAAA